MRIIGGKDYYDSALAYGADPSIVFIRHKNKKFPFDALPHLPVIVPNPSLCLSVQVHFCGRLYLGLMIPTEEPGSMRSHTPCWSAEDFRKRYARPNPDLEAAEAYFAQSGTERFRSQLADAGVAIASTKLEEDRCMGRNRYDWDIDHSRLRLDLGFHRAVDHHQAYQQISMWVGGVLANNKPVPKIASEKVRLEKRGFDPKTSFRKDRSP